MQYIIKSIEKEGEVEGKFGTQMRTTFTVENDEQGRRLSAFSKYAMKVGQEIDGDIVQNGEWWNFKFTPKGTFHKAPSADSEAMLKKIYDEVYATRVSVQSILQNLQGSGTIAKPVGAPTVYSEKEEEFDSSLIPF